MSSYHTNSLKNADVFMVMGSIYAEVARYDSAISVGKYDQADQAFARAMELIDFAKTASNLNHAQKLEIQEFGTLFTQKAETHSKSNFDNYLMPFAMAARLRQFS